MRGILVLAMVAVVTAGAAGAAETITSHLGHPGPKWEPGLTPSKLGWGKDAQPYPHQFVVNPKDGSELVWVPAGEFTMGSGGPGPLIRRDSGGRRDLHHAHGRTGAQLREDPGEARDPVQPAPVGEEAFDDEKPAHWVRITKGFWLHKYEVTNEQYARFVADTGYSKSAEWRNHAPERDRHPVVMVAWHDAQAYAQWAGLQLPTEAQWEYAARGPEGRTYPWGDKWDEAKCCNASHRAEGEIGTFPVGSFPKGESWCGALDLAGNVSEWCADWHAESYYRQSPAHDPQGPDPGGAKVVRGGSWVSLNPGTFRGACRGGDDPANRRSICGFRCARGL